MALRVAGLVTDGFSSAAEFLEHVGPERPGCLVLDVRMPGMSGLQLLSRMVERGDCRPTVMITGYAEVRAAVDAMKLGAVEFLLKPFAAETLIQTVTQALARDGERRRAQHQRSAAAERLAVLSRQEQMVLWGIIRGLTNRQIAQELDVSLRTVQSRRSGLFKTLDVTSKAELVALVEQAGWSAIDGR